MKVNPNNHIEPGDIAKVLRSESEASQPTSQFEERLWATLKSKIAAEPTVIQQATSTPSPWFSYFNVALGTVALVLVGVIGLRLAYSPTPVSAPSGAVVAQDTRPSNVQYVTLRESNSETTQEATTIAMVNTPTVPEREQLTTLQVRPSYAITKTPTVDDITTFINSVAEPSQNTLVTKSTYPTEEETPVEIFPTETASPESPQHETSVYARVAFEKDTLTWEEMNQLLADQNVTGITVTLSKNEIDGKSLADTHVVIRDALDNLTDSTTDTYGQFVFYPEPFTPEELDSLEGNPEDYTLYELYIGDVDPNTEHSIPAVFSGYDDEWFVILN